MKHRPAREAVLAAADQAKGERLRLRFRIDGLDHVVHAVFHERPALPEAAWRACVEVLSIACLVDVSTVSMARCARLLTANPGRHGRAVFESAARALRLELLAENGLGVAERDIRLQVAGRPRTWQPEAPANPNRVLLLMGGGKDSLYALSLLRRAGYDVECFYLTEPRRTWQQLRRVYRTLEQQGVRQHRAFLDVNRMGALERRHRCGYASQFQIGDVISMALPYAIERRCRYLALGLERSSDVATFRYAGLPVNHQHQKSSVFVRQLNRYLGWRLGGAVEVVSPLHGLYDTGIYARFLRHGGDLVELQSSCGAANSRSRHCGRCEKCAFLAALVAALGGDRALYDRLFTRDPLDDEPLFLETWLARRPLGCVGLTGEVESALDAAAALGWEGAVVRAWKRRARSAPAPGLETFLPAAHNRLVPEAMGARIQPILDGDGAGVVLPAP